MLYRRYEWLVERYTIDVRDANPDNHRVVDTRTDRVYAATAREALEKLRAAPPSLGFLYDYEVLGSLHFDTLVGDRHYFVPLNIHRQD